MALTDEQVAKLAALADSLPPPQHIATVIGGALQTGVRTATKDRTAAMLGRLQAAAAVHVAQVDEQIAPLAARRKSIEEVKASITERLQAAITEMQSGHDPAIPAEADLLAEIEGAGA